MQGFDSTRITMALRRLLGRATTTPLTSADMEIARSMGAAFWFIAAILVAVLLPFDPPTENLGAGGWVIAGIGVLGAFGVGLRRLDPRGRSSLSEIYIFSLIAVLLIALLEWSAGGRTSPYHYLYMLPLLYAAAAHSPKRVLAFFAVVVVVIWAPLLYEGADRQIVLDIATQLAMLLAISATVWGMFILLRVQRETIREQRARAELMAREDALTGLGNRRAFAEALSREVARARREEEPLGVIVGDLDHFKEINDRAGHATGDEYLRRAAEALLATARGGDTCFRWGGDEFAVLLPDADRKQAEAVAERLREAVRASSSRDGGERLEMTCGVADLEDDAAPEALIAAADRDLLQRKRLHLRAH